MNYKIRNIFVKSIEWTSQKRHLVRYETLMTQGNEHILHHWSMNECSNEIKQIYANKAMLKPGSCLSMDETDEEIL